MIVTILEGRKDAHLRDPCGIEIAESWAAPAWLSNPDAAPTISCHAMLCMFRVLAPNSILQT